VASNSVGSTVSADAQLIFHNVLAWGWNAYGQTNLPPGLSNVVQISAGSRHNLALLRDGSVVAWGSGAQTNVPPGLKNVTAVAAGDSHSLALTADGTVAAWGDNLAGETNLPAGLTNVAAIAAGGRHSLALLSDGSVVTWGANGSGQNPPTLTNVVAIAAGATHSLALRADGTLLAWGDNQFGQTNVPKNLTNVVAMSGGVQHTLALQADGTVVAWGTDSYGQTDIPASLTRAVAIVAGDYHSLAITNDGYVIGWGAGATNASAFPQLGQAQVPIPIAGVAAVAAGTAHSLLLVGNGAPFITQTPLSRVGYKNEPVLFYVEATGAWPLYFQWRVGGTNLPGATGQALVLEDATNAGPYQVVVSNAFGVAISPPAILDFAGAPPMVVTQPKDQSGYLGNGARLQVVATGSLPLSYQWRFDGHDLPGGTNSILAFDNLTMAQAGAYSVVVSNAFGVVSSAKAAVHLVQVAGWGDDRYGQTDVPSGLADVIQVAGGYYHSLALKADGTVTAWGATIGGFEGVDYGQTAVPSDATNVVAIAAGGYHSLALRADGTVVAWGAGGKAATNVIFFPPNHYGQSIVPAGLDNVVAIAAGQYHSAAVQSDGRLIVWGGTPFSPVTNIPPAATNIVAVACGPGSVIVLKSDGSVLAWGTSVPGGVPGSPNTVAIAPGVALRADGRVISSFLQPAGIIVEIAGANNQILARRSDGTVVSWGSTPAPIPVGLANAIGIGCGQGYALVAFGDGSLQITGQPANQKVDIGGTAFFRVVAAGSPPLAYQWRVNGADLPGATNFWLRLPNVQLTDTGDYALVVSNSAQALTSHVAQLEVRIPSLPLGAALGAPGLTWLTLGNGFWFAETNITHGGTAAAQSGPIFDSQQSTIQTVAYGPGALSFWWKVSSEQWFDFLSFALNGQTQAAISGEVDWQLFQMAIPPGTNRLSWTYAKDPSVSAGLDAGWLAQVAYQTNPPVIVTEPASVVSPMGTNIALTVTASGAPPLSYQWSKSGASLPAATNWTLLITNANRHDSGWYAAAVSNPGGTTLSSNAQVLVQVPQQLSAVGWLRQSGFTFLSGDADGQPLLTNDLGGFELQASTNLSDWTVLSSGFELTNGTLLIADPDATNFGNRFYRIIER
jgi:alpha-tubulin suppressor-like RCC1 family protein